MHRVCVCVCKNDGFIRSSETDIIIPGPRFPVWMNLTILTKSKLKCVKVYQVPQGWEA